MMPIPSVHSQRRRFWAKVEKTPTCWVWTGALTHNGYGQVHRHRGDAIRTRRSHRLSWELHRGPIPDGVLVLHRCDVRHCVRPGHLYLGTPRDNSTDMVSRGRAGKFRVSP